jgi:hypothetical protein
MIQYAKKVLPNFGAWEYLFRKELVKIYNWMPEDQMYEFCMWCYENFHHRYSDLLDEIFTNTKGKSNLTLQNIEYNTDRSKVDQYKNKNFLVAI